MEVEGISEGGWEFVASQLSGFQRGFDFSEGYAAECA
jgi:hypothetical protein